MRMKRKNDFSSEPEDVVFLRRFIAENGQRLLKESGPPHSVQVTRQGRVWRIVLEFEGRERNLVVKDIGGNTFIKTPEQLWKLQSYVRSRTPRLTESFPEILDVIPDRRWIVMEYVSGLVFEDLLCGILRGNKKGREAVKVYLSQVMDVFLTMKTLSVPSSDLVFLSESNDNFLTYYKTLFQIGWIRRRLPFPFDTYEKFSVGFDRQLVIQPFHHLVPADCQPKNIIISQTGNPRLIDPDFARSNTFLGMAFFLASLDRIGSRYPLPKTQAILSQWKRIWMASLWEKAGSSFVDEMSFYYPFALLRTAQMHLLIQRWFAPYLHWYYGRCLRSFLERLKTIRVRDSHESALELFEYP